jgi:hypothetical protein
MKNPTIRVEDLLEVRLTSDDCFLKIKETLTRIGVSSKKEKKLFQSCHILHKKGKYYIVHFKEMFSLDGLDTNISENDLHRRNTIATLLEQWELLEIVDEDRVHEKAPLSQIKILPFNEKDEWELIAKYSIGGK